MSDRRACASSIGSPPALEPAPFRNQTEASALSDPGGANTPEGGGGICEAASRGQGGRTRGARLHPVRDDRAGTAGLPRVPGVQRSLAAPLPAVRVAPRAARVRAKDPVLRDRGGGKVAGAPATGGEGPAAAAGAGPLRAGSARAGRGRVGRANANGASGQAAAARAAGARAEAQPRGQGAQAGPHRRAGAQARSRDRPGSGPQDLRAAAGAPGAGPAPQHVAQERRQALPAATGGDRPSGGWSRARRLWLASARPARAPDAGPGGGRQACAGAAAAHSGGGPGAGVRPAINVLGGVWGRDESGIPGRPSSRPSDPPRARRRDPRRRRGPDRTRRRCGSSRPSSRAALLASRACPPLRAHRLPTRQDALAPLPGGTPSLAGRLRRTGVGLAPNLSQVSGVALLELSFKLRNNSSQAGRRLKELSVAIRDSATMTHGQCWSIGSFLVAKQHPDQG